MRGVALHGLDQIRNQIVALLELHVDVGKGLVDALAERDQAIIGAEGKEDENDDDAENDPAGRHGLKLLMRQTNAGSLTELKACSRRPRGGYLLGRPQGAPSSMLK